MKKPTAKERSSYASYLGSIKSERKAEASRRNGKLGGRPKRNIGYAMFIPKGAR